MEIGDLNKVWETKALKKPGEEEARKILEKIAKHVQPIMRKHKWRVKLLSEFYPNNPALLGLNVGGGVELKLRLRKPNREWDFFRYDQVLDTMLHELCHNEHGPHNAAFYKLWDELRKECEELMTKGITGSGEGFDLPGRRLGGFSRQPPLSTLRQTALAAAEKRVRLVSLLPSGPRRLGGDNNIMGALSPIQAAAMAAERRLQDELWCGSQAYGVLDDEDSRSGLPQKGQTRDQSDGSSKSPIDVKTNALDVAPWKKSRLANNHVTMGQEPRFRDVPVLASTSRSILDHGASDSDNGKGIASWECEICTLLNPPLAPICDACGVNKPKNVGTKFKIWSCKFCTLENSVKLDKCTACGQWRYSYGAPVSSQLNLGT